MDSEELGSHIRSASSADGRRREAITSRIVAACWPAGAEDRSVRSALEWLRRWYPERAGAPIPGCSCATGRCGVCN